jgi:glycosyltransferase involved in cell wall biosynthesis
MNILSKAFKTFFTEGPVPFIKKTLNFIKRAVYGVPAQVDPGVYNFIVDYSRPPIDKKKMDERFRSGDKNKMVINWVIPDTKTISGGHTTIFRMVKFLEEFGHKNRIYVFGGSYHGSNKKLKEFMNDNYFKMDAEFYTDISSMKDCDAVIATTWQTAYPVRAIQNARKKFYFVQDFEPWFFPMNSEYKMAENTYKFGFYGICAGPWLAKTVKENYGMDADYFNLAYNPEIYFPRESKKTAVVETSDEYYKAKKNVELGDIKVPRIVAYARPVTPRRCFKLMIQGLRELSMRGIDFDLSFVGWDLTPYIIPFEYRNLRVLNHKGLADLYNWADIGVVFSPTNYSLLPHEMMACKLPVVEMKGQTTEVVFKDGENVTLADPDPIAIADKIEELLNNPEKRKQQAETAYEYVKQFSWEKSARKVEEMLKRELQ